MGIIPPKLDNQGKPGTEPSFTEAGHEGGPVVAGMWSAMQAKEKGTPPAAKPDRNFEDFMMELGVESHIQEQAVSAMKQKLVDLRPEFADAVRNFGGRGIIS